MGAAWSTRNEPKDEGPHNPSIRNDTLKREQMDKALGIYRPKAPTKLTSALKQIEKNMEDKSGAREIIERVQKETMAGQMKKPYTPPPGTAPPPSDQDPFKIVEDEKKKKKDAKK